MNVISDVFVCILGQRHPVFFVCAEGMGGWISGKYYYGLPQDCARVGGGGGGTGVRGHGKRCAVIPWCRAGRTGIGV